MAVIETKYSVGDKVWFATTDTETKQHPCPDCLDTKAWTAKSPAGDEFTFACPRCAAGYSSFDKLSLKYTAAVPRARRLTIGSIRHESQTAFNRGAKTSYMCKETGVGSGSIYDEHRLFETEEAALEAAALMAADQNKSGWIAERYNRTLEISDYQLTSARLKEVQELLSRAGSLFWNINDLFESIQEASDKDAILEAVDEYREWHLKRDLASVASAMSAFGQDAERLEAKPASAVGNAETPNLPDRGASGDAEPPRSTPLDGASL